LHNLLQHELGRFLGYAAHSARAQDIGKYALFTYVLPDYL
jgi:hypothetical protein